MYIYRKLIAILIVLVFIGCSYTVTPKPDTGNIYNPFIRPYPYKAALILDDDFLRTFYTITQPGATFKYEIVPALKTALQSSLKHAFTELIILPGISKKLFDKKKIDVAIYPKIFDFEMEITGEGPTIASYTYTSEMQLDVIIYDWDGNGIDKQRVKGKAVRKGTLPPMTPWGYKKAVKSGEYDPDQDEGAHNKWQVASKAIEDCCSKLLEQIKGSPMIQDYFTWLQEAKTRMAQPKKIEPEKQPPPIARPVKPAEKKKPQHIPRQLEKQDEDAIVLE